MGKHALVDRGVVVVASPLYRNTGTARRKEQFATSHAIFVLGHEQQTIQSLQHCCLSMWDKTPYLKKKGLEHENRTNHPRLKCPICKTLSAGTESIGKKQEYQEAGIELEIAQNYIEQLQQLVKEQQ